MNNIQRMANEGKLCVAGPFLEKGEIRGIYIFNVTTIEEARKLTETDPLIKSGGLIMELHQWYGSAALQQINTIHSTITKTSFSSFSTSLLSSTTTSLESASMLGA